MLFIRVIFFSLRWALLLLMAARPSCLEKDSQDAQEFAAVFERVHATESSFRVLNQVLYNANGNESFIESFPADVYLNRNQTIFYFSTSDGTLIPIRVRLSTALGPGGTRLRYLTRPAPFRICLSKDEMGSYRLSFQLKDRAAVNPRLSPEQQQQVFDKDGWVQDRTKRSRLFLSLSGFPGAEDLLRQNDPTAPSQSTPEENEGDPPACFICSFSNCWKEFSR